MAPKKEVIKVQQGVKVSDMVGAKEKGAAKAKAKAGAKKAESSSSSSSAEDDGIGEDVCLIFDCGSGFVKAGFSNDENPAFQYQSVGGPPKNYSEQRKAMYWGQEAIDMGDGVNLTYPVENGIIENFDYMEKLYHYTMFEQMKANPEQHPIMITEPPYNPLKNREKLLELMFEKFGIPSINISVSSVLTLLGHGRLTGCVLDSGAGVTSTLPVYEGFGLPHAIHRMDTAGREINGCLGKLLAQRDICLTTTAGRQAMQEIKHNLCYCAKDSHSHKAEPVKYKLPDGKEIELKDELWRTAEAFFLPAMAGLDPEGKGVHQMLSDTINLCDLDLRKTLTNNIVLGGGGTNMKGFKDRLHKELEGLVPSAIADKIKIIQSPNGSHAAYKGAYVFCSLRNMQENKWMTAGQYEERGVSYIHELIQVKYK